jgi:hypothetical protein
MNLTKFALAFACALAALPAAAASRIVPAAPSSFELVNLRMEVDSCAFVPSTVRVRAEGSTLKVTQQLNQCLVAGTPGIADVQLGSLAPGRYRVEVYATPTIDVAPIETLAFEVTERPEIAVFPPPIRPLTSYTGMWWNPQESGWGLALNQGVSNALFGAWFVYGASGQPEWFTLQGGQWTSSTRWTGIVYRTTGPFFAGPDFDPRLVLVQSAGTATLEFSQSPGNEDHARFTYTVNGTTATRVLARMSF